MSTAPVKVRNPVCLVVIDGWGISKDKQGNAIANANTPVMDRLCSTNSIPIHAYGNHVGIPDGLMGNSESGHLNIGAGRVVWQDIVRINDAMTTNAIRTNAALSAACNNAITGNGRLHFLGLVSNGGVHSHIDHLFGLVQAAHLHGVPNCYVQFFSDGCDVAPTSGVDFVEQVQNFLRRENYGHLATVVGRYYAMDKDDHWDRLKIAYEGLVGGVGERAAEANVIDVMRARYAEGPQSTDEFMQPIILSDEGRIRNYDTLVFFNFRADRMRQILEVFGIDRHFDSEIPHPTGLHISCMTLYSDDVIFPMLFPPQPMKNVLAEWLSVQGVKQFHCAETVKYEHVTAFFNSNREFVGEDTCMVESPKEVATYDLKPEMNCAGVAYKMAEEMATKKYPFVLCNFAPPDMVGHTGNYDATVMACEATDKAVGIVENACKEHGYILMVTADHGNAEKMIDETGGRHTAHTCNKVPLTSSGRRRFKADKHEREPALRDVAPTVLDVMGLPIPPEMDGVSLLLPYCSVSVTHHMQ